MQQHAGLLFLTKSTGRIFLKLDDSTWTVPTFPRKSNLLKDAQPLLEEYSKGKIVPIELYTSQDKGFEYGTYVCLIDYEFIPKDRFTFCWSSLDLLPKNLHSGLKATLNNSLIKTKIETILELENAIIEEQ
jgi:hypothetical protein